MLNLMQNTDVIVISSEPFGSEKVRTSYLMTLLARGKRVYFFGKPIIGMSRKATFYYNKEAHQITFVQPFLPLDVSVFDRGDAMVKLIKDFIKDEGMKDVTLWTDSEEAMPIVRKLNPEVVIFDKASPEMRFGNKLEQELLGRADIVLSGVKNTEEIELEIEHLISEHVEGLPFADVTELVMKQRHLNNYMNRNIVARYVS